MLRKPMAVALVLLILSGTFVACTGENFFGVSLEAFRKTPPTEKDDILDENLEEEEPEQDLQPDTNEITEPPEETEENPKDSVSKDTYLIEVDISSQLVRISKDGEAFKEMICSTGIEGKETPLGEFQIQNRGTWFFNNNYKQGAKYWVSFRDWGIYLFHSVAMDENQEIIPEEEAKLGTPASHGCVRLPVEDAKWIYDNIPAETKVIIR